MSVPRLLQIAESFIQAGELEDALDSINQHLEENGVDDAALRLRAAVNARVSGQYHAALADLDALGQQQPEDYILRASLLARAGQPQAALQASAAGNAAYPDHERLMEQYVYLLRRYGQPEQALAIIDQLPEGWRWSQWAGDLYADQGKDAEAIAHYSAAIQTLQVRYNLLGDQAAHIPEDESISETASVSMTLAVIYARLLLARAGCAQRLGHYADADADYQQAQVLMPGDPMIPFNRGLMAFQQGQAVQARQWVASALEAASTTLQAQMQAVLAQDTYAGLGSDSVK